MALPGTWGMNKHINVLDKFLVISFGELQLAIKHSITSI